MTELRVVRDEDERLPIRVQKYWEGHNGTYYHWVVGNETSVIGYLDQAVCQRKAEEYRARRLVAMGPAEDDE